ncbi:MAG: hypothetical protein GTO45_04475 [Candidatus Aminicenantes bacterium]|nr:hypothetical protein [Candidatus Aminicenantes bacterium]NIM78005.1 hypothetical protein [Candidatus Aminicenantes bacterium]NIN17327.1 hypothetical protein [Candidatus Aminicenantes bacterium]NIN41219.1 hypothetical protein [Candidatus Aminicenantes bacterium]NIN83993.1 hypothetical protein [Candidatus Aminicenantes bacterium]
MKRNQYGINFDLGVPLQSSEEFELLYVELYSEEKQRLINWIEDRNEGPMIVAGQIGTGKTTFIKKAFQEASIDCDVKIGFDTEVPPIHREDSGEYSWGKSLALLKNISVI